MSTDVMPRDQVRRMFLDLLGAVFADKEPPALPSSYKYARREDIEIVSDEAMKMLSEYFNNIPEHFLGNFQLQEMIQQKIIEIISSLVYIVKSQFILIDSK